MASADTRCFHCGESVPENGEITLQRESRSYPMCCNGCKAVAELIFSSGLDRYYQFRQTESRKASDDRERTQLAWQSCDQRQAMWGIGLPDGSRELLLQTEGIRCAACSWLRPDTAEPHRHESDGTGLQASFADRQRGRAPA
jgi:Cu2+-exporting ATPase